MNIYFTASVVGKKYHLNNYLKIIDVLKKAKHKVISDHIINTSENQINLQTKQQRLNFHDQLVNWISSADAMIVETTFPSISVGYEIKLALDHAKPVLILYSEGDPPTLLEHFRNENLVCQKYKPEDLEEIINEFLSYAQGASDSRFTFFITPEIANYLDKKSKEEKLPKSVYLRRLILDDMQNSR